MKSTGIIRKIDELGRFVLPIELRRYLSIDSNDMLEIFTQDDSIVIKKYNANCIFCGSDKDLVSYNDKTICQSCKKKISKL